MGMLGRDYIAITNQPRRRPRFRWLFLAGMFPLIVALLDATGQKPGGSMPGQGRVTSASISIPLASPLPLENYTSIASDNDLTDVAADTVASSLPVAIPTPAPDRTQSDAIAQPNSVVPEPAEPSPGPDWIEVAIQRGDTLSLAFERHELSYGDSLAIAHLEDHGRRFTRGLKAGDTLRVQADEAGHVLALDYPLSPLRTLEVRAADDAYRAEIVLADVVRRNAFAVGTIQSSFYADALDAGLSDRLIMKLATIFGWDIDFVMDIRVGDSFVVVYEELFRNGEKVRNGDILAAEFRNRGRSLRALRYTDADGKTAYYAPDGAAMKKAFIRTPLNQFRISSHFSRGRKHPVLNRIRRHEGTDYAAPTGTPIKATGDGRIVYRARKGGYGRTVTIKHNGRYTTRYAHMSRYAGGQRVGSFVKQGQTIGYVGSSGLATGPHLHYEFRVHGIARDPETVDLPEAQPIAEEYLADFRNRVEPLVAQIEALDRIELARNDAE